MAGALGYQAPTSVQVGTARTSTHNEHRRWQGGKLAATRLFTDCSRTTDDHVSRTDATEDGREGHDSLPSAQDLRWRLWTTAGLAFPSRRVESHIASVMTKLDLEPTPDNNRRVLAVLSWMRATDK